MLGEQRGEVQPGAGDADALTAGAASPADGSRSDAGAPASDPTMRGARCDFPFGLPLRLRFRRTRVAMRLLPLLGTYRSSRICEALPSPVVDEFPVWPRSRRASLFVSNCPRTRANVSRQSTGTLAHRPRVSKLQRPRVTRTAFAGSASWRVLDVSVRS